MVSEAYIARKTNELKKLDIERNLIIIELNQYYGIYDAITTEAYEKGIKLEGAYCEFCDTYKKASQAHSDFLHAKMDESAKWCDQMLKMLERSKHENNNKS